ncbi:hypothetical protein M3N64_09245 [Sporolactobacillus sp. CPB3-1]|uniref:Nitroreductase domain-containing protein n=1 Tax=Sporolactobacillus mangiferae TaxID=2940498 RepID=A0ABT0MBA6_9BACL|nr:hypothetical protein [Sporolactobacillus mangiferae]MCL1632135.1 hypothetical protein [Sporolactobacillus mangiferae]
MKRKGMRKLMIITISSLLAVLFLGSLALFLAGGLLQPRHYMQPWDPNYAKRFSDPRIRLTAYGLLAANGHNMQPWTIRLDRSNPMVFYLYADPARMSPMADPDARQMMITQGTFLEYVRVAGQTIGHPVTIDLFPEGTYDEPHLKQSMAEKPVAKIIMSNANPQKNHLFDAIYIPDTNRTAYQSKPLTHVQVAAFERLKTSEVTTTVFTDQTNADTLGKIAHDSATIEAHTARVMDEAAAIFRANEYQKNQTRYGFSFEGQGTSGFRLYFMQGLITLFPFLNNSKASADLMIQSTRAALDHTPAYAMISSRKNDRLSQVKSGMIYSRLNLTASSLGLAVQPVSQALEEYPEMRAQYTLIHRKYAAQGQTIQMLVRVGTPTEQVPQSMRRDVMDLIRH